MTKMDDQKRKASTAGISSVTARPVKRRASKACCCCRARKVRCDVVENGSPCTNCRLDQVECVVTESKRRKKSRVETDNPSLVSDSPPDAASEDGGNFLRRFSESRLSDNGVPASPSQQSLDLDQGQHMPHLIYQNQVQRVGSERLGRGMASNPAVPSTLPLHHVTSQIQQLLDPSFTTSPRPGDGLPDYIRGLPSRLQPEDVDYLAMKGALTIPDVPLRNELLKAYVHYVHTYMPLLDLEDFLQTIHHNDGVNRLSLLLFQAVMFAGTAFIDLQHLQAAGYTSRKAARKAFFQRARLLYDFDYEVDRISLVQSLLLMTYWYETPDDQKDTWHWMGVSLSLAHTIGLHRDPGNSRMDLRRQRMWKRIWWSTYTRDRLIALGMRRPMRVKDDDCDVPMLTLDDFDFHPLSPEIVAMVGHSEVLCNVDHQRELALMFIEKAKLCLCVSHVLSAQYSVLSHKFGGTMETTMMLVPKKSAAEAFEVRRCDQELEDWLANLRPEIQYSSAAGTAGAGAGKLTEAQEVLHSHRALLKMVYLTTSSALHRPQVLPSIPFPSTDAELQEISRNKVRHAAVEITDIAQDLHRLDLTRYFPTTGVTVLLPAVIIHLLDIKSSDPTVRMTSLQRFYQCMRILQRLREIYASADFATSFLEAAIRKAGIQLTVAPQDVQQPQQQPASASPGDVAAAAAAAAAAGSVMSPHTSRLNTLTPPPDSLAQKLPDLTYPKQMEPGPLGISEESLFASTPPPSDGSENGSTTINPKTNTAANPPADAFQIPNVDSELSLSQLMDLANDAEVTQNDFDALINFDDGEFFAADKTGGAGGQSRQPSSQLDPLSNPQMPVIGFEGQTHGHGQPRADGITADLDADLGLFA